MLSDDAKRTMLLAAAGAHPNEACGLLFDEYAYEVRNVSPNPAHNYVMDQAEVQALYAVHGEPTGMWHSHTDGSKHPSLSDLQFHPPGYRLVIVTTGEVHDHGVIP